MVDFSHFMLVLLGALLMYAYHHINEQTTKNNRLNEQNTRLAEEVRLLRNELSSTKETIQNLNRESKAKEERLSVDITKLTSEISSLKQELSSTKEINRMQIQSIRVESKMKEDVQRKVNEDIRSMRDDFVRTLGDVEKVLDNQERLQKDVRTLNQDVKQASDKINDMQRSMDDGRGREHQHHHVHEHKNESRSFGGMLLSAVRYGISVTASYVLGYTFGGIFSVVSGLLN